MNNKTVLLIGSGGMVGKNISENKPDYINLLTPSIEELNLLNYEEVFGFLKKYNPEYIIHAAGIVGGIQANINNPVRFLRENTLMSHNIIWGAYENRTPYFLNLGSSCMYPRDAKNPLKEEMILTGTLEPTNEGYALAKIFSQRLCSYINKERNNKNFKTIITCNLYGKYDKFDSEWGHMIPSVIRKIHDAKLKGDSEVTIWGDGKAKREFMFAADLADFIWLSIEDFENIPELLNIGLGFDYSINDYYKTISDVIGFKGSFVYDLSKPVGMKQKLVDTSRLSQTNWCSKTSLKDGIRITYEYYLNNYYQ